MFEDCPVHSVSHRSAPYNDSTRYTFTGATGRTEHLNAPQPLSRKERYGARRRDTREALAFTFAFIALATYCVGYWYLIR